MTDRSYQAYNLHDITISFTDPSEHGPSFKFVGVYFPPSKPLDSRLFDTLKELQPDLVQGDVNSYADSKFLSQRDVDFNNFVDQSSFIYGSNFATWISESRSAGPDQSIYSTSFDFMPLLSTTRGLLYHDHFSLITSLGDKDEPTRINKTYTKTIFNYDIVDKDLINSAFSQLNFQSTFSDIYAIGKAN